MAMAATFDSAIATATLYLVRELSRMWYFFDGLMNSHDITKSAGFVKMICLTLGCEIIKHSLQPLLGHKYCYGSCLALLCHLPLLCFIFVRLPFV